MSSEKRAPVDGHDDNVDDTFGRLLRLGCIVTLSIVGLLSLLLLALLFSE